MPDDIAIPSIVPPPAAKTFRFNDIDHYRSSIRKLDVDFVPLAYKVRAEQIILSLPGCDINYTKSFPRITDAGLAPDCTAIGFSMDDHEVPIRFNGVDRDRGVIVAGSHGASYTTVEQAVREFGSVFFTPAIEHRGWPLRPGEFRMFETSLTAHHRLRHLVREILALSAQPVAAVDVATRSAAMKESLLAGIDAAFADATMPKWAARANSARKLRIFQQITTILHDDLSRPIYSDELAARVGVSVRALHDAVQQYLGMSLHRYLRLRRLWLVRQRLLAGAGSVKATALALGFWHLGDFAKSYRQRFGETPSATLARVRGPDIDSIG